MNTNEVKEENVKTIVKLGIDVKDIADIYLKVATKGHDISKQKFIEQLTEIFKFFQSRNKGLEETQEVIYKDDVLNMIMKNRNMINLNVDKKIKAICEKLDSYYFMTQEETNKLIKANPKIFNINMLDLEIYSTVLSDYAVEVDNSIVNLFEYILKKQSELLSQNVNIIYSRLKYLEECKGTKKLSLEDVSNLGNVKFMVNKKEVQDEILKKYDNLPEYNGESLVEFKEKLRNIEK